MMRGKDEEKIMGPMFPRLHVNDTEKGGPRAPPRNKMALYEQLSIPSQRFNHVVLPCNPNNTGANLVHPSGQGGGNDRGIFFARQMHPRLPSEQYSQYSELSHPLSLVEQGKKLDEDDYRVPIFIHSVPTEFDKYNNDINGGKLSPSDPPRLCPHSKFQRAKEMCVLEHSKKKQAGNNKNAENSNEFIDRLRNDDSGEVELCAESQLSTDTEKRCSSSSQKALPSEDQNTPQDLSNDSGSLEDGSCGPLQTGSLERGDSVSETSILDAVSGRDMTPDDIVGIIGQKHFWKARRAIVNQQRIFAVQVFELHRLIKVQKLIASSPHLMHEDSAYIGKPINTLIGKKRPLDYSVKATSNPSKTKKDSVNPSQNKECSAENTFEKASIPSAQNGPPPCAPTTPPVIGNQHNASAPCFNHPQAHQWLIPVMSPTEGLVYKPYPGTGFVGQACGPPVPNPMFGNFPAPAYGIPAPPTSYPFPPFPPLGAQSYFPPYGMPMMPTPAFSGSSAEQTNPLPVPAREATPTVPTLKEGPDIEVQASTASCPSERQAVSRERRSMLPLFPTSPPVDASNACLEVCVPKVIKVVPHNGLSASESAERIFRSIQEERKQYDSV